MDSQKKSPRPGTANTDAVQPDPEAIRRPNYAYEEQEQGIRQTPDPEDMKQQQDKALRTDNHNPGGHKENETKD